MKNQLVTKYMPLTKRIKAFYKGRACYVPHDPALDYQKDHEIAAWALMEKLKLNSKLKVVFDSGDKNEIKWNVVKR